MLVVCREHFRWRSVEAQCFRIDQAGLEGGLGCEVRMLQRMDGRPDLERSPRMGEAVDLDDVEEAY